MQNLQVRIDTLSKVFDRWLSDDNEYMLRAVHQSVEEDYFNFSDVQFALKALKDVLSKDTLEEWIQKSGVSDEQDARGENVLCLHAGNLPLVGLQDAIAVLLSGARYTGKISRKDPYLLPTFLNEVKKTETWSGEDVQWSHRLDDFEDMQNDAILFAGSEESVPDVKKAIKKYNLEKPGAEFLIRTAHFSMAYFDQNSPEKFKELTEAILRYGGKGCRSVAVVVSPFEFKEVRKKLKNSFKSFWEDNPQHESPPPKLRQRFAYNEAVKRNQLWMDKFLIQEGGVELDQDFICYWITGDESTAVKWAQELGNQLQSVYVTEGTTKIPNLKQETERLSYAQKPPVYWQPDGTDILKWLCR